MLALRQSMLWRAWRPITRWRCRWALHMVSGDQCQVMASSPCCPVMLMSLH